ncbi:hypothetical protein [Cryptosporangium sp. NPDC051539]|uniref:hypothetical protein n=1 Tax=Cryptosporangium sp. NPDC051539 TaxID=3363962 RepID=UPI003799CFE3
MRAKGITYDTGWVRYGANSLPTFDPGRVASDLQLIRDELHCNAVRITGGDAGRIDTAASIAVDLGLEVWYSPYPLDLPQDEILTLFADCAERAEKLRRRGGEIVFVAGAELTLMCPGFLPGETFHDRIAPLVGRDPQMPQLIETASARLKSFFESAVPLIRERFGGQVTYASIQLDRVDWAPFDLISIDLYRTAEIADQLPAGVRTYASMGKPLAITEFGCATFEGARDRGAQGLEIVEYDDETGVPLRLDGDYTRDEAGQAETIAELLEIFEAEGVDSAFVFLFALHDHPHRPGGHPRYDLDLASYGIVRVLENQPVPWTPKAAFGTIADLYARA